MKETTLARTELTLALLLTSLGARAAVDPKEGTAQVAAKSIIEQCSEFPADHPYSCEKLAGMDMIKACNELPADHPKGCRALAAMDVIKACNQFPPDHPKGCRALLSFVPKCPPGTAPGIDCKHQLVQAEPRLFRDRDGELPSVTSFGAVRTAGLSLPGQ